MIYKKILRPFSLLPFLQNKIKEWDKTGMIFKAKCLF